MGVIAARHYPTCCLAAVSWILKGCRLRSDSCRCLERLSATNHLFKQTQTHVNTFESRLRIFAFNVNVGSSQSVKNRLKIAQVHQRYCYPRLPHSSYPASICSTSHLLLLLFPSLSFPKACHHFQSYKCWLEIHIKSCGRPSHPLVLLPSHLLRCLRAQFTSNSCAICTEIPFQNFFVVILLVMYQLQ